MTNIDGVEFWNNDCLNSTVGYDFFFNFFIYGLDKIKKMRISQPFKKLTVSDQQLKSVTKINQWNKEDVTKIQK